MTGRTGALAIVSCVVAGVPALSPAGEVGAVVAAIAAEGAESAGALEFGRRNANDLATLNSVRLGLKEAGLEDAAQRYFDELRDRADTPPVLLNLSLAHVDRLMGKSLLRQGVLSARSQRAVEPLLGTDAHAWVGHYITGLNNLYWPDWFGKAKTAKTFLARAVDLSEMREREEGLQPGDKYALAYLALGDAHALLDDVAGARAAWRSGSRRYPYVTDFSARQAIADEDLHEAVRALRDADVPIDTDLSFELRRASRAFTVTLTGGTLFGPGPLTDQPLDPGSLNGLMLDHALTGEILPDNNGGAEPNLPGEVRQGRAVDGRFSDGTPVNESIDVGYVELMNGKFKLFLAAIHNGANDGRVHFLLDRSWHWSIHDDIGIDPGFAAGVIKFDDFTFSTSPRVLPVSWQTERGVPGAVDVAGSLKSGDVVPGRIGDADFDGRVDGVFNAIGRFPLSSIILPGAPFAQTRTFTSDIPIAPQQAGMLALANGLNHLLLSAAHGGAADASIAEAGERLEEARAHFAGAPAWTEALAPEVRAELERLLAIDATVAPAVLCAAHGRLDGLAPRAGLFRTDRDISRVGISCAS